MRGIAGWSSWLVSVTACSILAAEAGAPQAPPPLSLASGTYKAQPWHGMQIKYNVSGASISSEDEGGLFCCWDRVLQGTLASSGVLSVSGAVGFAEGSSAECRVEVTVDGQSKTWSQIVKPGASGTTWVPFTVAMPLTANAARGSIAIEMTGRYPSGTRGLSVKGAFTKAGVGARPEPAVAPELPPAAQRPDLNNSASPQTAAAFAGAWRGTWTNSLGQRGDDSLTLREDEAGHLAGTWTGSITVTGQRTGPATLELTGKTATRAYTITGRLDGATLRLEYVVRRLDSAGTYTGTSVFTKSPSSTLATVRQR